MILGRLLYIMVGLCISQRRLGEVGCHRYVLYQERYINHDLKDMSWSSWANLLGRVKNLVSELSQCVQGLSQSKLAGLMQDFIRRCAQISNQLFL